MNGKNIEQLVESAWRRQLSSDERHRLKVWLREHPEQRDELVLDTDLGRILRELPAVAVPSNFTHQVMAALEKEAEKENRSAVRRRWQLGGPFRRWMPRVAVAGILCLGIMGIWHRHTANNRAEMAASLQNVVTLAAVPVADEPTDLEIWRDFETIRRLGAALADDELIAAFEQK